MADLRILQVDYENVTDNQPEDGAVAVYNRTSGKWEPSPASLILTPVQTWEPVVTTVSAYAIQRSDYIIIGKLCWIDLRCTFDISAGADTSNLYVTLPIAAVHTDGTALSAAFTTSDIGILGAVSRIEPGAADKARLRKVDGSNFGVANGHIGRISGFYRIA